MIGHTFTKLYAIVPHLWLSYEFEWRDLMAREWVGFHLGYWTIDYIFTLHAFIEVKHHCSSNVFLLFCGLLKDA